MHPCDVPSKDFLTSGAKVFVTSVDIDVSADTLFSALEEADTWVNFVDDIAKVEWTSAKPFGVGTTRSVTLNNGVVADEVFTAWEQGRRMEFYFSAISKPIFQAVYENYVITPNGDNRCTLEWTFALKPRGIMKLLLPLIGGVLKRNNNKAFALLKTQMESA